MLCCGGWALSCSVVADSFSMSFSYDRRVVRSVSFSSSTKKRARTVAPLWTSCKRKFLASQRQEEPSVAL